MFSEPWQQQIFLVVLLVVVFWAFIKDVLSVELVAMGAFFACIVTGILPWSVETGPGVSLADQLEQERFLAFRVFAHPAPLTIIAMFIVSAALERTGVIERLGDWFEDVAATSEGRMRLVMMVLVGVLSAVMINTPVVVIFMPIVIRICRNKDWVASRFLIPLSYAAIVGGTMTLVGTSTNIIAADIAAKSGMKPFGMYEITPLGIAFCLVTWIYLSTIGKKLLVDRSTLAALIDSDTSREFITHAFVGAGSDLIGQIAAESPFGKAKRIRILEIRREGLRLEQPLNELRLNEEDEIVFKGALEALRGVSKGDGLVMRGDDTDLGLEGVRTESAVLMEGIVGPDSTMVGKSLRELNFRQRFGVIILAVHRRGRNLRERFEDEQLAFGDTLLVQGPVDKMRRLFETRDFINLSAPKEQKMRKEKAPFALAALALFVVLGALSSFDLIVKIPTVVLGFGAAMVVLLTRCLDPKEAYAAIEWRVILMIVGMLGFGMAMQRSGLAELTAFKLIEWTHWMEPWMVLSLFYLLAAVSTELVSNQAVAVLLTPLGIIVGQQLGVDPRPFVVAIMFGSSASFATPIGYQTNTYVYGAGGYKFGDFFRVGFPLAVILWLVASFLIPVLWPLEL